MIFRGDVSHPRMQTNKKMARLFCHFICKMSSFSYNVDHSSQMLMLNKGITYTN